MHSLAQIPVKLNTSFLVVLFGLPGLTLLTSGITEAFIVFLFIAVLFIFVVLHEYGHAWAAQRCGYQVQEITLWYLGGLARIEGLEDAPPKDDAFISIAGPAVNLVLAGIFSLLSYIGFSTYFEILIFLNLILGLANLIPAFPLDGGRLLRSGLHWYYGSRQYATKITAKVGIIIGSSLLIVSLIYGKLFITLMFAYVVFVCYAVLTNEKLVI